MDPTLRARKLVRFLLEREPNKAEEASFSAADFDCDAFLIRLLCSDEVTARAGDITRHLIEHMRAEAAKESLPNKMAHSLVLLREDLSRLQGQLDRMNGQMLDLLRQEDRIASLFSDIRDIQRDFNNMRARMQEVETDMMRRMEVGHGV